MTMSMPFRFLPRRLTLLALAFCLGMAAGCSSKDANAPPEDLPAEELYSRGQTDMEAGNFQEAAKSFEEVERQHPYSQWATRGEIMAAYSFYEANQYDESVAASERFIELHPGSKDVPYAYYLIGIAYYEQISDVGRDQEMTEKALSSFN